jgi:hypothetical protein
MKRTSPLKCKHERLSPDHYVPVSCGNEHLGCFGGRESHCLDCGLFIVDDPCFSTSGESGWPERRWRNYWRKKRVRA